LKSFKYLGCLIAEDELCEKEIRGRMGMAKRIFLDNRKITYKQIKSGVKKLSQ